MFHQAPPTSANYFNSYSSLEPDQAVRMNGEGRTLSGVDNSFKFSYQQHQFPEFSSNSANNCIFSLPQLLILRGTTCEPSPLTAKIILWVQQPGGGWRTDCLPGLCHHQRNFSLIFPMINSNRCIVLRLCVLVLDILISYQQIKNDVWDLNS